MRAFARAPLSESSLAIPRGIVNERAVDSADNKQRIDIHPIGADDIGLQPVADDQRALGRPMFMQFPHVAATKIGS